MRTGAAVGISLALTIGIIAFAAGGGWLWGLGSIFAAGTVGYGTGWLAGGGGVDGTDLEEGAGIGLSGDSELDN